MAKEQKTSDAGQKEQDAHVCEECGMKLSSYNPGPNCWQHTIGHPWRGPSAKPRYD
jgi:hypothetical protein